jgi:polysaccharide export outer membrane protein
MSPRQSLNRLVAPATWSVALAFLVLCARPAITAAQTADYIVGAQDVLTIAIWDQPDLSGKYNVEGDGTFGFPLVGRIKAAGLTLREVEEALKKRLADGYFKHPQLSVTVEQYRSQRIFIVGEVRNPGMYPLSGDMSLIEALAHAGSLNIGASREAVIVRPPSGRAVNGPTLPEQGEAEVVRVDLKQLETGSLDQNVTLRDGDTIFVARAETFFVVGEVRTPGSYQMQKGLTVLQALSLAGGIGDRGSDARIKIVRIVNGKRTELKVKLTDPVQAGDTLVVPERFF